MKKSKSIALILTLIFFPLLLCLVLILTMGYQKIDIIGTHQRVQPSEFNRMYSPEELKADLNYLIQMIEDVHPEPYIYTPESIIYEEKDRIEAELNTGMSRINFFLKVVPLVTCLNEGHTSIYPPYEEYYHYRSSGGLLFPFDVKFRGFDAIITADYSQDSSIVSGSQLLSINDIPMKDIIEELLRQVSGEKIQNRLGALEERFRHRLWLAYRFESEFLITYLSREEGRRFSRVVSGVTYETILQKQKRKSDDERDAHYIYHSLPDEKIGIIDLRQFVDLPKFKSFLENSFSQFQTEGNTDLIIDLRENGGGFSDLVDPLLSYITDQPVIDGLNMQIKVSRQLKDYYQSTLRWYVKWLPIQYLHPTWRKIWKTPEGGLVQIYSPPERPRENPLRFQGHVYLLIGPKTYSTAQGVAAMVKDYKLGTLLGEETGGIASSFGDWLPFDLPHTRLWIFASTKRIPRPSGVFNGRGVLPDHEVKQTDEDFKKGIDSVLEFTKHLIESK